MWFLSVLLLFCPADTLDDRRDALFEAVTAYAEPLGLAWDSTTVRVGWADLNGDGQDDALVSLAGPAWCGSGGCTVLVFEAMGDFDAQEFGPFRPAAEISMMHGPVLVADGDGDWSDLVVEAEDGTTRVLRFDGETYPFSPGGAPHLGGPRPQGTTLFAD